MKPVLALHGGAGNISSHGRLQKELKRIYTLSFKYLKNHSALETVIYAVTLLEDSCDFNAGTGSKLQQDGKARMSASVMDGKRQKFSAVLNIENVKNPVQVAVLLLHEKDRVLAGEFATQFARSKGFAVYNPVTEKRKKEWLKKQNELSMESGGTVGAVALDQKGNLASATSTGGKGFERIGRVSDTAMPAGNFSNSKAAVSCTGIGEDIIDNGLASKIVFRVTDGMSLKKAFQKSFGEVKKHNHYAGAIGVDSKGNMCVDYSTKAMSFYPVS